MTREFRSSGRVPHHTSPSPATSRGPALTLGSSRERTLATPRRHARQRATRLRLVGGSVARCAGSMREEKVTTRLLPIPRISGDLLIPHRVPREALHPSEWIVHNEAPR